MIQILIVEDNEAKRSHIKDVVLAVANIQSSDVHLASTVKEAKSFLYQNAYDLMILDLVLPIDKGDETSPKNGVSFLEDIHMNPSIKPPIYIVGLSAYSELVAEHGPDFTKKLWNLIEYSAVSEGWREQLKTLVFHLVKMRQRFIGQSTKKSLYDVAWLTALSSPEFEAVKRLNGGDWKEVKVDDEPAKFYETTFDFDGRRVKVIGAHADQMGMTAASHMATKMILYFRPHYLIMTGIAAGISDRGVNYGDVLIAEQSWDYGSGKMRDVDATKEGGIVDVLFQKDTRDIQLSAELKACAGSFKMNRTDILDRVRRDWVGEQPPTTLQVHIGPVASGSYVLSSQDVLDNIKDQQRKLIGVEMETFGVYYAADHSPSQCTQAISIKAVSDFGDGTKDDRFQRYAAYTSAYVAYEFIRTELFGAEVANAGE